MLWSICVSPLKRSLAVPLQPKLEFSPRWTGVAQNWGALVAILEIMTPNNLLVFASSSPVIAFAASSAGCPIFRSSDTLLITEMDGKWNFEKLDDKNKVCQWTWVTGMLWTTKAHTNEIFRSNNNIDSIFLNTQSKYVAQYASISGFLFYSIVPIHQLLKQPILSRCHSNPMSVF